MIIKRLQLTAGIVLLIFLTGCNVTKHLKSNETLYTGGKVKINNNGRIPDKSGLSQTLEELVPKANAKIFGMRPKLWVYYNVDPGDKKKGLKAWIRRKLGEPPVLLENINTETIEGKMLSVLYNKGYFQGQVNSEEVGKGKKIGLKFTASVKSPYRIKKLFYPPLKTKIDSQIAEFKEKTLLRKNDVFNLEKLEAERDRINAGLKELGYYYFNSDFLIFQVDSTIGDRKVNLYLNYKPEIPQKGLQTYRIEKIFMTPEYEIADTSNVQNHEVLVDSIHFIKKGNGLFRPKSLTRLVFLKPDSLYSNQDHNITLNRLMGLDVFKYVNIRFAESDSIGPGRLRASIQMSPLLKKSLRAEAQVYTKSTNFAGPAIQFSFKNRNAFRGAELLIINLNTAFETQFSGQYKGYYAYEIQPQVQLFLPRFLLPFNISPKKSLFVPRTKMEVSYRLQNIIKRYKQNSLNFSFGYQWKETIARQHELNPIDVSYINYDLREADTAFQSRINREPSLQVNFRDQVILGSNYTYTYNNLLEKAGKGRHHFYFQTNLDASGNLMKLAKTIVNNKKKTIGGDVPYFQYSRAEVDFRYYHDFSKSERLASRIFVGVGYPYGNSETLPFSKQFYIGGPSSLRAFKARTIGPGIFRDPNPASAFFNQLGDMRIEGNLEYRFDLISILKGAIFIDAGNTWLTRKIKSDSLLIGGDQSTPINPDKNDQVFSMNKLFKELAIGTGVGLRVDVSFLVLRLDLGFPIRQFWFYNKATSNYELRNGKDRWAFNDINFLDPNWRKRNLVLNIAIGYPF